MKFFRAPQVRLAAPLLHSAICALFASVGASGLCAQAPSSEPAKVRIANPTIGQIRGVVFDSLTMKPLSHASVMLMSSTRTVVTDDKGRFSFDSVPPGQQTIAFSTPQLDSLGLGTLGSTVAVSANQTARVTVASPSLHTLWNYRCRANNTIGPDSGVVWGTIRSASGDNVAQNAAADFSWYDLSNFQIAGLLINETRKEVEADESGQYFACGLPTDVAIATEGIGTKSASGAVQYSIGAMRIRRLDLLVSADMVIPDTVILRTAEDSMRADRPRGAAILRGVVFNEKQRPLDNAIVSIASVDTTVRTNKDGKFLLSGLPAGTHQLQVRRVGSAPESQFVDLRPDTAADVTVRMSNATVLAKVNVRANVRGASMKGADRVEYEQRQKMGLGRSIAGDELAKRPDIYSALSNFPGLYIDRVGFGIVASMRGSAFTRRCTPAVFLDGVPSDLEIASSLPPDHFRAIEVFNSGPMVPFQYMKEIGCGSILFWSKNARW